MTPKSIKIKHVVTIWEPNWFRRDNTVWWFHEKFPNGPRLICIPFFTFTINRKK